MSLYSLLFFQYGGGIRYSENYFNSNATATPSYLIRRMDINPAWSGTEIVDELNKANAKALPYTDDFSQNNGWNNNWIQSWGITTIDGNGTLVLSPEVSNAGAATVLDGSGGWKDYVATVTLNAQDQNGAYMWVRFQNDSNTAACNFGNGFAHIEQIVNGKEKVIQGIVDPNIVIPKGDFKITARVQGRHVECILNNGISISTDYLDPTLNQGGIGFKTWNHMHGGNNLTIKNIQVNPYSAGTSSMPVVKNQENPLVTSL
jgi:hypothetical protein